MGVKASSQPNPESSPPPVTGVNRVLIAGAASPIAVAAAAELAHNYRLRLLDIKQSEGPAQGEWMVGSISDYETCCRAVHGVDAVVNFALARKTGADWESDTDRIFDVNVKGLYQLLLASSEAGIRRFVHISSTAPVIAHWFEGTGGILLDAPYRVTGRYTLTKAVQELVCTTVAQMLGLPVVMLRIWRPVDASAVDVRRPGMIDRADVGRACGRALKYQMKKTVETFYVVATAEAHGRFETEPTRELLGFEPAHDFSDLPPGEAE